MKEWGDKNGSRSLKKERGKAGVGDGNRTRNRRSHSPMLYQLSYSHRRL